MIIDEFPVQEAKFIHGVMVHQVHQELAHFWSYRSKFKVTLRIVVIPLRSHHNKRPLTIIDRASSNKTIDPKITIFSPLLKIHLAVVLCKTYSTDGEDVEE
jgi:hypothetical protein